MNLEKLRADLIMHFENFVCSACADISERCEQVKNASEEELVKMAEKLRFDMEKYK